MNGASCEVPGSTEQWGGAVGRTRFTRGAGVRNTALEAKGGSPNGINDGSFSSTYRVLLFSCALCESERWLGVRRRDESEKHSDVFFREDLAWEKEKRKILHFGGAASASRILFPRIPFSGHSRSNGLAKV